MLFEEFYCGTGSFLLFSEQLTRFPGLLVLFFFQVKYLAVKIALFHAFT